MKRLWISLALAAVAASVGTAVAWSQSASSDDLAVGKLLVAAKGLPDPNFAKTVVLLIHYDQQGAVGLMINRRTEVPISRALPELGESKRAADPICLGGPVELQDVMALVKSPKKPDDSSSVLSDVYLLSSKTALEKGLAASAGAGDLRVYLGYCGWEAGQLENEARQGGWSIFAADRGFPNSGVVFDPNPETLWARLMVRTEQQIAENTPPNAIPPTSTDEGEGR